MAVSVSAWMRRPTPGTPDGPTVGLALQWGLLAALAATIGLGVAGWLAGSVVGVTGWALLRRGLRRSGTARLGPANTVTLTRAVLVSGVTALAAEALTRPVPVGAVVALAVVALALDAVDGQVARWTDSTTPLGARFDMEVDAFLILVLSVLLVPPVGAWVIAIGGMRYAFVAAGRFLPWLAADALPPRPARKVVAAGQGVVLVAAVTGLLPPLVTVAALAAALVALTWSFGRDLWWLGRARSGSVAVADDRS